MKTQRHIKIYSQIFYKINIIAFMVVFLLMASDLETTEGFGHTKFALGEYDSFQQEGDIRRYEGETLSYDISFLWFDKAATATVSFYKRGNYYEALLIAETKGVVGWFTSYRKHIYRSTFDVLENGKRLRSNKFEREVIIGTAKDKTIHQINYTTRTHRWTNQKSDSGAITSEEKGSEDIPEGITYDDILTAFYNFRNSAYGKLVKGATFKINTIPEKGVKDISVIIKSEKEEEEIRSQLGREKGDELLLDVIVPKEIFKTKTGELLFWSSKHYIPLSTTVVEYIMLGDLHANFVKRTVDKSFVPVVDLTK